MNEYIKKSVDELKEAETQFKEDMDKHKAKGDKGSVENQNSDFAVTLFNQITESTIKTIQSPQLIEAMTKVCAKINADEELVTSVLNIMAICMNNASYQAVLFYDDLLKIELTRQFDNVGHHINLTKADMEGVKAVLQVHKNQIGEINNTLILNNLKKINDMNIPFAPGVGGGGVSCGHGEGNNSAGIGGGGTTIKNK